MWTGGGGGGRGDLQHPVASSLFSADTGRGSAECFILLGHVEPGKNVFFAGIDVKYWVIRNSGCLFYNSAITKPGVYVLASW